MVYVSVDVEANEPIPGDYEMVLFGAVVVRPGLTDTFEGKLKPVSDNYDSKTLTFYRFTER